MRSCRDKYKKALLLSVAVIIVPLTNYIVKRKECNLIKNAYGRTIKVTGSDMTVDVQGEGNVPAIVFLPGLGSPSPVLEFLPLAKELSKNFKVVTIEPFGYGLSDRSQRERTIENIVEELHECLRKTGCDQYYLMAHSISGLYALYWANRYPQEVQGFIGIDCSVPGQSDKEPYPIKMATINKVYLWAQKAMNIFGIARLISVRNHRKAVYADVDYPYTERELEVFRILSIDDAANSTVMNELKHMESNLQKVRDMKFPQSVPVLHFLAEDNCKLLDTWEDLHREIIMETGKSKLVHLGKKHYLHIEQREKMASEVKKWVKAI